MWQPESYVPLFVCITLSAGCDTVSGPSDEVPIERDTVTVMTYNIFHDGESANMGVPPWPERRDGIVDIIRSRAPDAVGLQEAEVWQVAWLLDQLPEYAAVARGPFADPGIEGAETVAILYRSDELQAQESGHFWYSESPDAPGSYGSEAFGGTDRPRMATWVRLRRTNSSAAQGFYVFNTHFAADGTAVDPELARSRSAELLVQRVAARSHASDHFFLLGDLNTAPGEWPLRYLLGSRCELSSDCMVSPEFRAIDAWAARHPGVNDTGTRCNAVTGGSGARVDHVLVWDPAPDAGSCDAGSGPCEAPTVLSADIVSGGPSCPSDHRPVIATLVLPLPGSPN